MRDNVHVRSVESKNMRQGRETYRLISGFSAKLKISSQEYEKFIKLVSIIFNESLIWQLKKRR